MYAPGHGNYLEFLLKQFLAFMVLPILLYVVLVLSVKEIIIIKWLGYENKYDWSDDCDEGIIILPISMFGVGLLNVLIVLPVSLALVPIAFYWLLLKIWQGFYIKII